MTHCRRASPLPWRTCVDGLRRGRGSDAPRGRWRNFLVWPIEQASRAVITRADLPPAFPARLPERPPPLVVIGMHRSGTSLAAAMLSDMGVYMGPASGEPDGIPGEQFLRDGYAEAVAFRDLNEQLLAAAGASWSCPEPFLLRRDEPEFARACLQ